MAPPVNQKLVVKVLVPQKVSSTYNDMELYRRWMLKKTLKGQKLELSDIPDALMESILERLSSADRIRFGATCQKHLSVVTTQQHQYRLLYQFRTIDKLPWLATFDCVGLLSSSERRFVFVLFAPLQQPGRPSYANYEILDPKAEVLGVHPHTSIKASKKGWFLCLWPKKSYETTGKRKDEDYYDDDDFDMEDEDYYDDDDFDVTCFLLFCPFTKRIIKLPDLDHYLDSEDGQVSCHATFSSDDPSSPDCVFFFLYKRNFPDTYCISTLDQKNQKWNTNFFDKLLIGDVSSVVYHEGCFYCLSIQGELASYHVVNQTWNLIIPPFPLFNNLYSAGRPRVYLVVCEGKLTFAFVRSENYERNNVDVFRCGLFEFSSSTRTWVEKTSLGDHAVFLGNPTSFSVSVPSESKVGGRMYFYSSWMDKAFPIYYSLKDGRCHLSKDCDYWSGVGERGIRGMWMEPLG